MFNDKIFHSFTNSSEHLLAQNFIQKNYQKSFHINIEDFYPHFLIIKNNLDDTYKSVIGINNAKNKKLFSEHYLQKNIEQELLTVPHIKKSIHNNHSNKGLAREDIVEVGNLATLGGKEFRKLIIALTAYLYTNGYKYVIFTTFPVISNSFKKMGLQLHPIATASLEQLPTIDQKKWGQEYYKLDPKVFVGDIQQGFYSISSTIDKAAPELKSIWYKTINLASKQKQTSIAA